MRYHDTQVAAVGMTVGFGLMVALGSGCMLPSLDDPGAAGVDAYEQDQQNSGPDDGSESKADSNDPPPDATGGGDAGVNDTGSSGPEDTGSGGGGGGDDTGGEDEDPDTGGGGSDDPAFSEVQTLLDENCAVCHSSGTGTSSALEFPSESPSPAEYESALSGYINEGDGENSPLYVKLTPDAAAGQEMPIGSWNVDEQEAEQTIKDWIDAGAPYE